MCARDGKLAGRAAFAPHPSPHPLFDFTLTALRIILHRCNIKTALAKTQLMQRSLQGQQFKDPPYS